MRIILDGSDAVVGTRAIRRYTINLINEFLEKDFGAQFNVFLNYFRGTLPGIFQKIQNNDNFSVVHYPLPRRISLPLWNTLKFPYLELLTGDADIFHALGDDCPPVKKAVYIMTLHGIVYMVRPDLIDPKYAGFKQIWLKKMSHRADYFISVSESTRNEFLSFFDYVDPQKIKVIPLGIGKEFRIIERESIRKKLFDRFGIDKPYILYIGGMEAHKNIKGIINAFSLLSESHKEIELVFAGYERHPPADVVDLSISLKLIHRIRFIEYLDQESDDLPLLYNGAECFVFPSFSEGWASPPLEAMACGVPVVTSNVSSLPETVGDAACLVNPKDYDEIAYAIREVLNDGEKRAELIKKGIQHAAKYTWRHCAEKTFDLYKNISKS